MISRESETEKNKCFSGPVPERKQENTLDMVLMKVAEPC